MYVVYIDILFLINVFMDMTIFYIATLILNRSIRKRRILLGSILAALIYCFVISIPVLQNMPYMLYVLFIPMLSILYLYKPLSIKEFLKIYLICMGVAFTMGGTVFSLWSMFGYDANVSAISILWLVGIAITLAVIFSLSFRQIRKRVLLPRFEYDIKIKYIGKEICIKSILDTGNCLYTPIGHKPVIVVTYDALKDIFTHEQEVIISKYKNNILELACSNNFSPSYIIPFNSVGCKLGILLGIEVDQVNIQKDCYEKCVDKCIIGIAFNHLFNDKSYHALLHPDLILN